MEKMSMNLSAAKASAPTPMLHIAENTVNALIAGLLAWSISYALISAAHFEIKAIPSLINVLLISVIFSLIFLNRYTVITFVTVSVLSLSGYSYYLFHYHKWDALVAKASDIYFWLSGYMNYEVALNSSYSEIIALLLFILVSFLTVMFTACFFNFYILTLMGCGVFVSQWVLDYFASDIALYVFVLVFLILYFKKVYSSGRSQSERLAPEIFIIWTIPICLMVVLGAALIPSKPTPIEWEWLDTKVNTLFNRINNYLEVYSSSEFFSFDKTGFGRNNGRLGGRVTPDYRNVLSVQSNNRVYLSGAVKDTYTGHSWINTDIVSDIPYTNDGNSEVIIDSMETILGFRINAFIDNIDLNEIYNDEKITVTLADMKTRTVFYPSKTTNIQLSDSNTLLMRSNGDIYTGNIQNKGFNYAIDYSFIHRDNPAVESILRKSKKGYYDSVQDNGNGRRFNYLFDSRLRQFTVNDNQYYQMREDYFLLNRNLLFLRTRANDIYSKYTQLPESLPSRVKELAQSLTDGIDNDYDKIKALEKYVSSFQYTLKPNDTPKDRDFVDYFLFDIQQGYCTYYASAIAILSRSIGIPSRYVEGYITPVNKSEQDTFEITNEQAHAWAEMYLEGFGWIPFEATRAFSYNFYHASADSGETIGDEITENTELDSTEEETEPGDDTLGTTAVNATGTLRTLLLAAVLAGLLLLTLLSFIFYNALRCFFIFKKAGSVRPKEAAVIYYSAILKLAGFDNHAIRDNETPLQYSNRLGTHYYLGSGVVGKITDIFMKARYGNKELSEEELILIIDAYKKMIEIIKEKCGNFKFFVSRYILGKI